MSKNLHVITLTMSMCWRLGLCINA